MLDEQGRWAAEERSRSPQRAPQAEQSRKEDCCCPRGKTRKPDGTEGFRQAARLAIIRYAEEINGEILLNLPSVTRSEWR